MGVDKINHGQCVTGRKEKRLQDGTWTEPRGPSPKKGTRGARGGGMKEGAKEYIHIM